MSLFYCHKCGKLSGPEPVCNSCGSTEVGYYSPITDMEGWWASGKTNG